MANCTYTFTGADGKSITIKGIPALKEFLLEGGLEKFAPMRAAEMRASATQDLDGQVDAIVSFSPREKPAPKKTVTAYKLFRVYAKKPGQLFPLFVDPNTPVPVGVWLDADEGEAAGTTKTGKPQVKSKLGPLAYRPGWHAGDVPIATHIGGEPAVRFDDESGKNKQLPTIRKGDEVWAEVEMAADVDWQTEANRRAIPYKTNNPDTGAVKGQPNPGTAAITDGIPLDGFYRYKTNPNMKGNWLIGGSIKVTRILSDAEVEAINKAAGVADLPRKEPFDAKKYGFDDVLFSNRQTETAAFKNWFGDSKVLDAKNKPLVVYHGSGYIDEDNDTFTAFESGWAPGIHFTDDPDTAYEFARASSSSDNHIFPVYLSIQNPLVLEKRAAQSFIKNGVDNQERVIDKAKAKGHDGLIVKDVVDLGKQSTHYVVFEPNQIKSATGNRGTFDVNEEDIRLSKRPEFFSQLQRSIEEVPDRLATQPAPQWKAWLASNASKLGIKKDEVEWSGINDFLDLQGKNKLSREQVVAFLKDNGVRVQDVQYGTLTEQERHEEAQRIALDRYGEEYGDLDHSQQMDVDEDVEGETTGYGDYVLPGGDNYREMLITLPPAMRQRDLERMMYLEAKYRRMSTPAQWAFDDSEEGKELKALQAKSKEGEYRNRHWQEANVVAHLRMNDRTDSEGNKVLFIEELQSDWGQEGRDKGFRGSKGFTVREDTSGKPELKGRWEVVDSEGNIEEGFKSQTEAQRWADIEQKGQGVPKAPFVTKTEGWLNLALKRAIMAAVQGGYDKVAFVNGEQSAERYGLSNVVDKLTWKPKDEAKDISIDLRDKYLMLRADAKGVVTDVPDGSAANKAQYVGKTLDEIVGKEVAKKILGEESGQLSGEGLKVGGEGMVKFYGAGEDPLAPVGTDKNGKPLYAIVPQTLNSLLPKLGGGKLGMTEINIAAREGRNEGLKVKYSYAGPTLTRAEINDVLAAKDLSVGIEGQLRDIGKAVESGTPFAKAVVDFGSRAAAEALGGKLNVLDRVPSQQLSFDVTDKMRETVSAGVPLFSRKQFAAAQGQRFTLRDETYTGTVKRNMQDYFARVKDVQEALLAQGGTVGEAQNVYLAEELSYGRLQEQLQDFKDDVIKPLIKDVKDAGLELSELALYAYARHAPERNRVIAARNRTFAQGEGSGMSTIEANNIINAFIAEGKEPALKDLHDKLMQITQATRLVLLSEGLITQDQFDEMQNQYADYVPLRGFAEDEDLESGRKVSGPRVGGRGFNIRGKETMRALGRESKAGHLIENIVIDYERAIARAERNTVAKVFLDLVTTNPDPGLWEIDAERTKAAFDRATGQVKYNTLIDKGEDTISVKIDGKEVYIKIKDPLLLRAMRNAAKDETGAIDRVLAMSLGRYTALMRNTLTRFNPAFGFTNAFKDLGFGAVSSLADLGPKGVALYLKHYANPIQSGAIYEEFRASGASTGGWHMRDQTELQKELQHLLDWAGGSNLKSSAYALGKSTLNALEFIGQFSETQARFAAYKAAREMGRSPAEAGSIAKNLTTNFNRKGEWGSTMNTLYLFYNAGVQGSAKMLSNLRSPYVMAAMAGLTGLSAGLAAFGASVGGDDDDGEAYWDKIPQFEKERNLIIMLPPGKGLELKGASKVGTNGRYIKLPIQYGLNVFSSLGYQITDLARYGQDHSRGVSPAKAATNTVSSVFGAFNPFGGGFDPTKPAEVALAVSPSVVDLGVQALMGVNAFGKPVAPRKYDEQLPDSENFGPGMAGTWEQRLARWLSESTGGDRAVGGAIDVSPGSIRNIVRNLTGGTGDFLTSVFVNIPSKLLTPEGEVGARDVPVLKAFYGEVDEATDVGLAYERRGEVMEAATQAANRQKLGIEVEYDAKSKGLQSLGNAAKAFTKQMTAIRKEELRVAEDKELTDAQRAAQRKELQKERAELATDFNEAYYGVKKDIAKGKFD